MKYLLSIALVFFTISVITAQDDVPKKKTTSDQSIVYHLKNNATVTNPDGTRSVIRKDAGTMILKNADKTQVVLQHGILTNPDGTQSVVHSNGHVSTIINADGSNTIINHKRSTSTVIGNNGMHMVTHNFGFNAERQNASKVDILLHQNWLNNTQSASDLVETK